VNTGEIKNVPSEKGTSGKPGKEWLPGLKGDTPKAYEQSYSHQGSNSTERKRDCCPDESPYNT